MKMKRLTILVIVTLSALFAFSGCEFADAVGDILTSVGGSAVDARAAALDGVDTVTVTFTEVNGTGVITATTSTTGAYSINYTTEGLYEVTAAKTGWFFIPQTVYIGGWLQTMPNILGVQLDSNAALQDSAISFILSWNETYFDLDGYLTFPDDNVSNTGFEGDHTPVSDNTFTDPYSLLPLASSGFGPDGSVDREKVSPLTTASYSTVNSVLGTGSDSRPAVEIDRDDRDGSGPEVITVRTLPFWPSDYNTTASYLVASGDTTKLPATIDGTSVAWTWIGVMEYYIDGWDSASDTINTRDPDGNLISATDGSGADAVLYIVQGSNLLGAFSVPEYANIRTANMVRINLFLGELAASAGYVSYFQFVPNIQTIDFAGILSVDAGTADVFGVVGAGR